MPRQLKRPGIIITLLVLTPMLLSIPIIFQVSSDTAARRFASEATIRISDDVTLHMLYPTRLRIEPAEHAGRPLMLWLERTQPAPNIDTTPYTITLHHDDSVLFTSSEGRMIPTEIVLSTEHPLQASHTLSMRQSPLARDLPTTTHLAITITTPDGTISDPIAPLAIALETPDQAQGRLFMHFLANPEALPGLASVLVSLVALVISLKVQRDRQNRERHELIQSVHTLLESDLPNAVRRLLKLETQSHKEEWEEPLLNELRDLRTRLEQERTYHERLFRQAGETIRQGSQAEERADTLLALVAHLLTGEHRQRVAVVQSILSPTRPPQPPSIEQVIEAAMWLWNEYDEDVQEVVVQALLWVHRQPGGRDTLRDIFKAAMSKERRLLRAPQLRDIAPNNETYHYLWPPLPMPPQREPDARTAEWLGANDLAYHPFGSGVPEFDHLLLHAWEAPEQWKAIKAAIPIAVIGDIAEDRSVVALMLRHELQTASHQTVFPVRLPLRFAERHADEDRHHDDLETIAWACGETWIMLLAHNPGTLFDQDEAQRFVLAELLLWVAGSINALRLWLRQSGLHDNAEGRILLRRIEEAVGQEPQPPTLTQGKLMQWLQIRPPGLNATYLIATCHPESGSSACWEQARTWLALTHELAQAGVMLKFVMPPPPSTFALPPALNTVALVWEPACLKTMLQARLRLCSERYKTFGALFGPLPLERADDLLIARAQGSLTRLLQVGYAVIRREVEGGSQETYLDKADFDAVLTEFRASTSRTPPLRLSDLNAPVQRLRNGINRVWSTFVRQK